MQLYVVKKCTRLYYKIVHNHVEVSEFIVYYRGSIYSVHYFCLIFLYGKNLVKLSFKLGKNHILILRLVGSAETMNLVSFQGTYSPDLTDVETKLNNSFGMVNVLSRKLELQGIPNKVTTAFLPRQICVAPYVKICNTAKVILPNSKSFWYKNFSGLTF